MFVILYQLPYHPLVIMGPFDCFENAEDYLAKHYPEHGNIKPLVACPVRYGFGEVA